LRRSDPSSPWAEAPNALGRRCKTKTKKKKILYASSHINAVVVATRNQ
jgi:hypothetical protein